MIIVSHNLSLYVDKYQLHRSLIYILSNMISTDCYLYLVSDKVDNGLTPHLEQYTLWSKVNHCHRWTAAKL